MYIFLDIDGVLNTKNDWNRLFSLRKENVDKLCNDYPGSKVILISSWKNGYISRNNKSNSEPIKHLETMLSNNVSIIGKTDSSNNKTRNTQIEEYIKLHPVITDYIIIDDDKSEYNQSFLNDKHLKLIDSRYGYR